MSKVSTWGLIYKDFCGFPTENMLKWRKQYAQINPDVKPCVHMNPSTRPLSSPINLELRVLYML